MGINDKLFRKPALCILAPSQYRNFKTFKNYGEYVLGQSME